MCHSKTNNLFPRELFFRLYQFIDLFGKIFYQAVNVIEYYELLIVSLPTQCHGFSDCNLKIQVLEL